MGLSNAQYDEIMRDYSARKLLHENQHQERKTEVYNKIPRVAEIEDEITALSMERARKLIMGQGSSKAEYLAKTAALADELKNALMIGGYPANYLDDIYDCPICKDTGVDGNSKCQCFRIAATKLLYKNSGISNILQVENFDHFDMSLFSKNVTKRFGTEEISSYENMESILEVCQDYINDFAEKKGNLLFTGEAGCGKTYMSHCIAKALLDKGFSVAYQSATQLFDRLADIQFGRDTSDESESLVQICSEADLLIIDDLGSEVTNTFTSSKLFDLMNERQLNGLGTIISTNESMEGLRDRYSDRIYSRLVGGYSIMPFFGNDIRKQIRRNQN